VDSRPKDRRDLAGEDGKAEIFGEALADLSDSLLAAVRASEVLFRHCR
jgi:hypothetical protein